MSPTCARRARRVSAPISSTSPHRRASADGSFNGVIVVAVLPSYFEEFYALIGQGPGSFYAMVRSDGAFLSRHPPRDRARRLNPQSGLRRAIDSGQVHGMFWTRRSQIDSEARRIGFLKLSGFPIYVLAGTSSVAIRGEWLSLMTTHLVFGLPATLLLFTRARGRAAAHAAPAR